MSLSKVKKYCSLLLRPNNFINGKKYILVISHMRSRSTLLSHILGSNNEICGYRELHLPYKNSFSLIKMKAALQSADNFDGCNYLLDKVLHNNLTIDTRLFGDKLKLLILLREPIGAVRSMFNMHRKLYSASNYLHLIDYYINRVNYIAQFAHAHEGKFLFVDSESLIDESEQILMNISRYLALKTKLSPYYRSFSETGVAGSGDPSKNIMAGKIIKTGDGLDKFQFTDEDKNKLMAAYSLCKITLKDLSIH